MRSTDNSKTHCKISLYVSNRFTIDDDRNTTSGEVYDRHFLKVDARLLQLTKLDALYSRISSASQKPQSVSVIKKNDSSGSARIIQTELPQLGQKIMATYGNRNSSCKAHVIFITLSATSERVDKFS